VSLWLPPEAQAEAQNKGFQERDDNWNELPIPVAVARMVEPGTRLFEDGELRVMVSQHPSGPMSGRWHLSISHPYRDPTWDEIVSARYALVPNEVWMMQVLPPKEVYVNVHEHVFHLWEIEPDDRFQIP